MSAASSVLDAMEAVEESWDFLAGNPDARIANTPFSIAPSLPQRDADAPFESELEGIGDEVEDDFLPHASVDENGLGEFRAVQLELQSGLVHRRAKHARQIHGKRRQIGQLIDCLHSSRFNAREI